MKRICAYGSLRLGEYNYDYYKKRYGAENIKHIKTIKLDGYKLYSLDSYPGIKKSTCGASIVVDILEVSEEIYNSIAYMEKNADYSQEILDIDGREVAIYIYDGFIIENKRVRSGNWSTYLNTRKLLDRSPFKDEYEIFDNGTD